MAIGFNVHPVGRNRFGFGATKLISFVRIVAAVRPYTRRGELSALERMIEHHKRTCSYFTYSGDRHCSCGRDEAIEQLRFILTTLAAYMENDVNPCNRNYIE